MLITHLAFWGTVELFSTVAAPLHTFTSNTQGLQFLLIIYVISIVTVKCYVMVVDSHLHFPNDWCCRAPLYVRIGHSYIFFWRNVYSGPLPVFDWAVWFLLLLSCRTSSCTVNINPWSIFCNFNRFFVIPVFLISFHKYLWGAYYWHMLNTF